MAIKVEDVVKGDLVEITLTPDAKKCLGIDYFFVPDISGETNIPGRTRVGYVTNIYENSVFLTQGWNKSQNKPEVEEGNSPVRYYFDAVESWIKR